MGALCVRVLRASRPHWGYALPRESFARMSSSIFFLVAAGVAFLSRAGAPIFSVHIRCDADTLSLDATPLSKASRASGSHEGGYRAQLRSADAESKSTPVGFEPTRPKCPCQQKRHRHNTCGVFIGHEVGDRFAETDDANLASFPVEAAPTCSLRVRANTPGQDRTGDLQRVSLTS